MADIRREAQKVPAVVERFVKQLVVTSKAVSLYPPSSTIPRENAAQSVALLRTLLQSRHEVSLQVTKDGLVWQGLPVFGGEPAYESFARALYARKVAEVRFHAGVEVTDMLAFLGALEVPPKELEASGGFEARLWDRQVDAVTVTEISTRVVEAGEERREEGEEWPPDADRIEQLVVRSFAGRGRDRLVLMRVLRDPRAVGVFLRAAVGLGPRPVSAVAGRVGSLTHAVDSMPSDERAGMYRAVAEAVLGLPGELRGDLVRSRLLPDARNDESLAQLLRQMNVDEVAAVLVEDLASGDVSNEGLSRAIRNLSQISLASRDEIVNAVGAEMRAHGMPEEDVSAVFEGLSPSRLEVRERPRRAEERPIEAVLRLVDLAPVGPDGGKPPDAALEGLREEARRGFTDGDVLVALVSLASLDPRPEAFSSMMSMVEDGLGVMLERGEYEIAADVAEALSQLATSESLDLAQRERVAVALRSLATPERMRLLNRGFRLFPDDSAEHDACARLLAVLGDCVLEPMLEVLAREQDMAARKSLVDLMATMAAGYVEDLGRHVDDERWYFVRNVVTILGKTHRSSILPYLVRTLRHADPRVRRETIRAASGVRDSRADEMLVAALGDDDEQNVSLAARYLGHALASGAVGPLLQVARGEGAGNREPAARVEAIEALGRIGDRSALAALRSLASRRSVLRGRGREIRTAAMAAVAAIEKAPRGGV